MIAAIRAACALLALSAFTRACTQSPAQTTASATTNSASQELAAARQAMAAKHYTEAERHFRNALGTDKDNTTARMGLAGSELALHQYEAAELDYRQVVAAEPQMWVAHKNLVIIEAALGRWEEFNRERALLRAARERGADGISTHESDVIDSFDIAGQHWIVREYFEPLGRTQARYNFESFAPDGRVREYISLEFGEAAKAAPPADTAIAIGEVKPASANDDRYALDWYTTKAHGVVRTYPAGEPDYVHVRADVLHWLRTHGSAISMNSSNH